METTKKKDFIELKFTGYANGEVFDSNIEEDLKQLNPEAKPSESIIVIGEGMVVPGFDKALEEKEFGKEYEISIKPKDGFGERDKNLVKTIPLKIFTEKKIIPRAGMPLLMDNMTARVITVSGARVITDFNNPLAGKELRYKFKIIKKVSDEKEKCSTILQFFFRFLPEFEIKDNVIVKGSKELNLFVDVFKERFKELIGKELKFEEVKKEAYSENKKS